MPRWCGHWLGGRVAQLRDGSKRYHIERMVGSHRYAFALDVSGEEDAKAELALFNRDPVAYMRDLAHVPDSTAGIGVDKKHVGLFLKHLEQLGRTYEYRMSVYHYLGIWRTWFGARPFREVTPAKLAAALVKWKTASRHRTIALKSYASYLRTTLHILPVGEDPTLALKVPPAQPEKSRRTKGYSMEQVALIYRHVAPQDVRDVIALRALTGMHEKEASRIARGEAEIRTVETKCEIAGVITFRHKSGEQHHQSVPAVALAAAVRLAASRKSIDNARQHREIEKAAEKATAAIKKNSTATETDVVPIKPGELRHSFITWCRTSGREVRPEGLGVPLDRIAEVVGHKTKRTTSRFYDSTQVPPMIAIPIELKHDEDPPVEVVSPRSRPASRRAERAQVARGGVPGQSSSAQTRRATRP